MSLRGRKGDVKHVTPEMFVAMRALADKLMTTCEPQQYNDELAELTQDQGRVLDSMALECAVCNHWFLPATMQDDGHRYVCEDCGK